MLMNTNGWLTGIKVKDTFVDSPTNDDILKSSNRIISALEKIQTSFNKTIDDNCLDIDMILDNFRFISGAITNNLDISKYDSLGIWKNWKDAFNEYMEMLYDMGDERVQVIGQRGISDGTYKFIWIN